MKYDHDQPCRRSVNSDHTIEGILNDPDLRAALEQDGIDADQLTDLLSALRTRLLAQRWRTAA